MFIQTSIGVRALGIGLIALVLLVSCGEEATPTTTSAPNDAVVVTLFPTTAPAASQPTAANPPLAIGGPLPGLSLTMPTNLASGNHEQQIPARTAPTDAPFWIGNPAYTLVTFSGYAHSGTLHAPSVKIYAVGDLLAFNDLTRMRVEGLQAALSERPIQPRGVVVADLYHDAQILQVQPKYLVFQGGSGVRYITQYIGDNPVPINNHELFYTFQGLSNNGQFYISVILPVSAPGLPDDGSIGAAQLGGALNAPAFQAYMKQIENTLATLPPDQFSPRLGELDQLIASLQLIP